MPGGAAPGLQLQHCCPGQLPKTSSRLFHLWAKWRRERDRPHNKLLMSVEGGKKVKHVHGKKKNLKYLDCRRAPPVQKRIEGKRQLNKFRRLRADGCRVTFVGAGEARGPRTNRTPLETTPGLVSRHALFPPTLALKKKKERK